MLGWVSSFAEDVVVISDGEGLYRCLLSGDWDLVSVPQGGVIVSVALRATGMELGHTEQTLRTCTAVFAGQVTAGPLTINVDVLRRGRSATQLLATVTNEGADSGATVIAVYGSKRDGPTISDLAPPKVPPPTACRSYREPPPPGVESFPALPFWTQVEGRAAIGHPPWEEFEPVGSEVATWLRFDDPPLLADGSLDPLGLVTLTDRMPGSIAERLGHRGPRWFAPSVDLTVQLLEPLRTEWVLAHDRARWADGGWGSVESHLWDENGMLVAYATQMVLFTSL
jgi:acyl-CoA thioesterase